MAEQYASFQGKEPNIDVNLFVNAATAGINQGNAQPNTLGAVFKGIQEGIGGGIKTAEGIQTIQSNAANLEVNTDPAVIQARKDEIIAKGDLGRVQSDTIRNNQTTIEATQALEIDQANKIATIKAQDATAALALNDLTKSQDVQSQLAVFKDPTYAGYFSRNPGAGQSYVEALKLQGGDPAVLDPIAKQFAELDYATRSRAGRQATQTLAQKAAAEDARDAGRFENSLLAIPAADKYLKADNTDYRLFDYVPSKTVNKSTGTSPYYDLTYGGQIIKPNAILHDQYKEKRKELDAWIAARSHSTGPVPASISQPKSETLPANAATSLDEQGLGLAKGSFTEKDITPEPQGKLSDNFLKGAVTFGGFTPYTVEQNIPAFNSLKSTISNIVKTPDPYNPVNRQILDSSVNSTAKQISNTNFEGNPALQSTYTMAGVAQYNERFNSVFDINPRNREKSTLAGNPQNQENTASSPLIESLRIKTPAELYFVTNGAGYIKQVGDYANKVLQANKQAIELNAKKAARNSNTPNILKEISGG